MAKDKGAKETPAVEVEAPKPEEKVEEVKPVEKPQATKEDIEQLRTELQKADGRWQSAQGVISKQKDEIESLKDNQELWKVLIGMRAQEMGVSEEEAAQDIQKKKPDFMQQFNMAQQGLETKRRQVRIDSYRSIVEDELGLKEGDDDYEVVQSLVLKGKFEKADKRIATIKAKKTEQPENREVTVKEESPEKSVDEIVEAKLKEKMIERGLLTPEGLEPSASAVESLAEIAREYTENPTEANRKRYETASRQA